MSKIAKRDRALREGRSVVRHVSPETLHQLIRQRGLEACGELVTRATPAQLTSVLDLDLWRHGGPGRDEQFDVDRFGEWLEVLVDAGESVAARTIAALDRHLVIAGLSRYLRVFDPGTFEPTESSDDEPIDRHEKMNSETSANVPECEVGGYLVRARRTDAWDAIVALLVTLETDHHHDFHALMQGCRRLSNSRPELGGLDDLLLAPEQHLHDVAIERERRQARLGYSTPADARAFLQMARQPRAASPAINPIVTHYFRTLEAHAGADRARLDDDDPGVMPRRPRALLEGAHDPGAERLPILRRLMEFLRHHDEAACLARSRELAFLANTLLAGSVQSRAFTAREASDAAACTCNLGLECGTTTPPDAFLADHDLVMAFEAGWSVLHRDVHLFVTDQLVSMLADLHCLDVDTERGLRRLRRALVEQRAAGTPWLAREAADVLATLDLTAWISVIGLLDECPVVPAALTAVLEHRATPVSPTAFEFISATAQIGDVRVFMRALPRVLSG
ncbi:MAG TPA: DUF6178 family protein [Vicinamibacterales bacterium]|nr:DUF6178 family protein [Vicinamibacterales bacterium]